MSSSGLPEARASDGESARKRNPGIDAAIVIALIFVGAVLAYRKVLRDPYVDSEYIESVAIQSLRTISSAQTLFRDRTADRSGRLDYATSLGVLAKANLIDAELGSGTKQRYQLAIDAADTFTWSATAKPQISGRHFFVDESGVIRFSTNKRATSLDSAIGG